MTIPPIIDYSNFLTEPFAKNQLWVDLINSVSNVMEYNINAPRRLLENIRHTSSERLYLQKNVKMLGFEDKSSILLDDDYRRLLQFISLYHEQNGNVSFTNFYGYIKGSFFNIFQLWTKDYITFVEDFQINMATQPITRGGNFYPTSHVNLYFDAETFPIQDPKDLTPFFYRIAPIHLVLKDIIATIFGNTSLTLDTGNAGLVEIQDVGVFVDLFVQKYSTTAIANQIVFNTGVNNISPMVFSINGINFFNAISISSPGSNTLIYNSTLGNYNIQAGDVVNVLYNINDSSYIQKLNITATLNQTVFNVGIVGLTFISIFINGINFPLECFIYPNGSTLVTYNPMLTSYTIQAGDIVLFLYSPANTNPLRELLFTATANQINFVTTVSNVVPLAFYVKGTDKINACTTSGNTVIYNPSTGMYTIQAGDIIVIRVQ